MGPKRRKTGRAAPATTNKQSDQEQSITAALCERLERCQDENGPDSDSGDFIVGIDANIPEDVRLRAHQAASILQGAITELQTAIDTAASLTNGNRAPVASSIEQAKELVAYAHRLSFTTSAPPGFIPGQTPLLHFKPPAPQDIQLRSSALHQFQREYDLKRKEGERAMAYSAEKEAKGAAIPSTTAPLGEQPKEDATAAAPVNLAGILSTLPPMPAGWKPGDPIPGLAPPALAAAGEVAPVEATTQQKPTLPAATQPAPVAVPVAAPRPTSAFDFALNPDMELEFDVGDSSESDDDDSDSD